MGAGAVRVLVVEDSADHAALIARTLRRQQPPFDVTVVGDGAACLDAVAAGGWTVVLLDYSLPQLSGLEVLRRIRERDGALPVVMVTGQGDERVAVAAMHAGAADYVMKSAGYLAALPTVLSRVLKQQELAVENARLYAETQRRLRESEALLELARSLTATLEYTPLLEGVARAAARACEMDRCSVYLWEQGRVVPVMSQFADGRTDGRVAEALRELQALRVDEAPFFATLARGAPIAIHDPDDPRLPPALARLGCRAVLGVPLVRQEHVIGALVLDDTGRVGPLGEARLALATAVASQVSLAVDNARLYRDAQQALGELRAMQDSLVRVETLRALGELASGAAHHLNNILAVVLGRAELLRRRTDGEPVRRELEIITRAARDGAEVVRRIQEFARTRQVQTLEPIDLNELARQVVEMTSVRWRDVSHADGVSIEVTCELSAIPPVAGHAASLREVIMNLVLNAVDALPAGGRIVVRTWRDGDRVALAVSDDGVGMSEEVLRRAQEPFFTTKGLKSTGLGLSVSYGVVQRHGGELTLDSAPGSGTTGTIRLPALAPTGAAAPPPVAEAPGRGLRILLIEDEPIVRETLADVLESMGHAVEQASGPLEGLRRLEASQAPDVVLTDLGMPEMTGWEVAQAARRRWPGLTVGLVTGWGEDPPATPEEQEAVSFVLAKPVTAEMLQETLARFAPA